MKILETVNLKKYYGKNDNLVKAVDNVNLTVEEGEFLAIMGKSGSGKSTLLHLLGGLDRPSSGKVIINGKEMFSMKDEALAIFRRRNIGFVFQSFNLMPVLNVWENITLPIGLDGKTPDEAYVNELLETMKIKDKVNNMPSTLSGGQQQRVAIARSLASKPSIILADEPTGNLDSKTSQEVMNLFRLSIKKYNQTLIMITHDEYIAQTADRIVRIEDGKLLNEASLI